MARRGSGGNGLFVLDSRKLEKRMRKLGLTKKALAKNAGLERNTINRVLREQGVRASTAHLIIQALEFESIEEVLLEPEEEALAETEQSGPAGGEWGVEAFEGPWMTASNGLQVRVCRMRHRLLSERLGRGKCYDVQHLSTDDQEQLREHLLRHPKVCERIGIHPNLAENLSTARGKETGVWWVVDRWVDGVTLDERLRSGPLAPVVLAWLMREIANGLQALHGAEVVFRELAPRRVIVDENKRRVVLTDFELAKLLEPGPSVSAEWPDDPYRAPEVDSGTVDVRADLYSWGRILMHAALGRLPAVGEDVEMLPGVDLPREVKKCARQCLSPAPSDRPPNIDAVLRAVRRWAGNA